MLFFLLCEQESMCVLEPLIVILKPRGEKPAKNGVNNEEVDLRNREKLSLNPIISAFA